MSTEKVSAIVSGVEALGYEVPIPVARLLAAIMHGTAHIGG